MRFLSFCLILGFLVSVGLQVGCVSSRVETGELARDYEEAVERLPFDEGFGFELEGHRYYFSFVYEHTENYSCPMMVGYRDNQLAYRIPYYKQMKELRKIYASKVEIKDKMRQALREIEKINAVPINCDAQHGSLKKPMSGVEKAEGVLTFIVYSPMALAGVIFAPDFTAQAIHQQNLIPRLRKIRLSMTPQEVLKTLKWKSQDTTSTPFKVQNIKAAGKTLIFLYEENKLIAFVWGKSTKP